MFCTAVDGNHPDLENGLSRYVIKSPPVTGVNWGCMIVDFFGLNL